MCINVLEIFFRDGHNEVASIFPFEPFHELDVAPASLALVEDINLRIVIFACNVVAIDGFIEIEIRLVLHIAPRFDALA